MQCPGQDSRYWTGHDIFETNCPKCGQGLEFFKDDAKRVCKGCGFKMLNPQINFGCAEYCPHAAQCLGSLPEGLRSTGPTLTLKERVCGAMRTYFGTDSKRIRHGEAVADIAEQINKYECGDPAVIMACSFLHDMDRSTDRDHAPAREEERAGGGPEVRTLLEELEVEPLIIDEVCDIIGPHHGPEAEHSVPFKVVHDAELIVTLENEQPEKQRTKKELLSIITETMLTDSGKKIAQAHFNVA